MAGISDGQGIGSWQSTGLSRKGSGVIQASDNFFCEMMSKLESQIAAAREARDRLLPKLMSGEIGVWPC